MTRSVSIRCSWDRSTWNNTLFPVGLVLLIGLPLMFMPEPIWIKVFIAVSCLVAVVPAYLWSPIGYAVEGDHLIVRRVLYRERIALSQIKEAMVMEKEEFQKGLRRLMGSGGMFGFYGTFRNDALGEFSSFVTRQDRVVALRLENGKAWVLSPDDVEGFLQGLGQKNRF